MYFEKQEFEIFKEIRWNRLALFLLFCISFALCRQNSFAQTKREKPIKILGINLDTLLQSPIKEIDTSFIVHYYQYLHIHPLLEDRNYALVVSDHQNQVAYRPNVTYSLGVGLAYKWFGFDFTFKLPFTEKALGTKGKTKQVGLGFSYSGRKIYFNTYYQSAKGMYLSNPEDFDVDWFVNNTVFPIRKDLSVKTLYTQAYYNFNYKRFSNPASFSFQERQRKSAGTFLLGGSLIAFELRSDSSLVPFPSKKALINKKVSFNSYGITVNPGYAHTFVFKQIFFASLFLRPGIAFKINKDFDLESASGPYQFKLGWEGNLVGTAGLNSDRFYTAISYSLLFFSNQLKDSGIYSSYTYLRILAGYRFNFRPKGVLKKLPGF